LGSITACILARNEERRIEDALRSLQGWTTQIIVIDNESDDRTVEIARAYTPHVLSAPRAANFDAARNLAIDVATGEWIFYLDADERVPPRLGPVLLDLIAQQGDQFEALVLPFKHYFCGQWMQHSGWWPGYTRPQLLKKGRFRYNERLHTGVEVDGRTRMFPADDPDLAIVHYSYDNLHHYLEKLNRYTSGEAESLLADGKSHSWQAQLAHFVHDWQNYYERGRADRDGMHGFILAFHSAFYRFSSRAKLWDLRRQQDGLAGPDPVPGSLREMLEFMAQISQEGAEPWLSLPHSPTSQVTPSLLPSVSPTPVPLLWRAPLFDPSGYADEARNLLLGLIAAGEEVVVAPERWGGEAGLPAEIRAVLDERTVAAGTPAELCVYHTLPGLQEPTPTARFNIARTMFETDRLPPLFVEKLARMDRIWVPTEFNRETFVRSGVDPDKIEVLPGSFDPAPFLITPKQICPRNTRKDAKGEESRYSWERGARGEGGSDTPPDAGLLPPYRFLSVFDWTLHKGWEVLIEAFVRAFPTPESAVGERCAELWIKTWSTNGYTLAQIQGQVEAHLRATTGQGLEAFPHLHVWEEHLPMEALPQLYRAFDAFVLPTRGEGWCRPLMEAMAAGLPTIATAWSGLTAFHNAEVGYPLPFRLVPVSEAGAREIPLYTGHCWAEPNQAALQRLLRQLVEHPEAGRAKGLLAQAFVATELSRTAVTPLLQTELAHCRQLAAQKSVPAPRRPEVPNIDAALLQRTDLNPTTGVAHGELRKAKANPVPRDPVAPVDFRERLGRPLRVRWEGDFALRSSLALVNREFCLELLGAGDVELSLTEQTTPWHRLTEADDPRFAALLPLRGRALSGPPDVTIRHHFPPSWSRPEHGKLVVIQPWEYGHLPQDWVPRVSAVDEVWAYSRFVREVYARSGVPAEKVRVVPLGFRPEIFQPEGPRYPLQTEKSTRFLFVGGALDRKGADLLLQAYLRAFWRDDDVCLVMKDMGTRTFYQGQTFADAFRQVQADPRAPEVLYLDDDLSDLDLAALYRSCTTVVLPYRGEGFGLSPLEGMASGLPVIVTAGGPTDDYVSDEVGLRVPQRKRYTGDHKVGPFVCTGDPWQLEPDLDALADALRWVRDHPEEARQRGAAAPEQVAAWTWNTAATQARERLAELILPASAQPVAAPVVWAGSNGSAPDRVQTTVGKVKFPSGKRFQPPQGPKGKPVSPSAAGTTQSKTEDASTPAIPTLTGSPVRAGSGLPGEKISLCMIARDEEPRLADCLRSIAPYVDELILVDTGSTDRTREIARECGAHVYDLPWPDSFAAARNASIELATGDWIFWMDADDVISPECGAGLRKLVTQHPQHDAAYHVAVHIPPGPGEFSPSVVDHVKLFPNRPDLRFEHRIHEQILPSLRRVGLDVRFSDLYVTHQNYDRSDEGQAKKRRRDYRLLELDLQDRPDHPFILFNLGMTYLYATKEYELAAHYLRRSLDHSHPADSIVRKAYAMLGTARICQGEWEAAIHANEEGRSHYPHDAELLFQAGQVYQQLGRFDPARLCLEQLTEGREDEHYRSVDVGLRTYRGRHELALLFRRMGDAPHCEQVLREIAAVQPTYLTAQVDLVETILLLGRKEEAHRLLEQIPAVKGVEEEVRRLSGLLGLST